MPIVSARLWRRGPPQTREGRPDARRPDSERSMSVEGFASLREFIRRAVRQINGVPNDVLSTLENQVRLHHELVLDAWDEMRSRGAAVIHVTDREYERARQLVNEILPAEGPEDVNLRRAQDPVAHSNNA